MDSNATLHALQQQLDSLIEQEKRVVQRLQEIFLDIQNEQSEILQLFAAARADSSQITSETVTVIQKMLLTKQQHLTRLKQEKDQLGPKRGVISREIQHYRTMIEDLGKTSH
jgi:hypothetical protein